MSRLLWVGGAATAVTAVAVGSHYLLSRYSAQASQGSSSSTAQLHMLTTATATPTMDVVFVHGLGGSTNGTWTNKQGVLWARDWLHDDAPAWRVLAYDYPNDPTHWNAHPSTMRLKDVGDEALLLLRLDGVGTRPFVLVGHSMGGLVNKAIMLAAKDLAGAKPGTAPDEDVKHAKAFVSNLRGIVFLGTPHRGAAAADIARYLDSLLIGLGRVAGNLQNLQLLAPHIHDLNNAFGRCGVRALSLGESVPTHGVVVVQRESSQMGIPSETYAQLGGKNHFDMSRPDDKQDSLYRLVLEFLMKAEAKAEALPALPAPSGPQRSLYEYEEKYRSVQESLFKLIKLQREHPFPEFAQMYALDAIKGTADEYNAARRALYGFWEDFVVSYSEAIYDDGPLARGSPTGWRNRAQEYLATNEVMDVTNYYRRQLDTKPGLDGQPKRNGEREYWESDNRPISYAYLEALLGHKTPTTESENLAKWKRVREIVHAELAKALVRSS